MSFFKLLSRTGHGARRRGSSRDPERGASLVFVALLLVALFSVMALAVDLGMLITARSEAQRTADAAALAGASEYMEVDGTSEGAEERARDYAGRNTIQKVLVNTEPEAGEVEVDVLHDDQEVRVWVGRPIPTAFARLIGIPQVPVRAMAAAQVLAAGSAQCLKPFAVPDVWTDEEGNGDPADYVPYDGSNDEVATGYGSLYRETYHRDFGRQISLKITDPNDEERLEPGIFLPWRIPPDPDMNEDCRYGPGGGAQGAATYRSNICNCNQQSIELGEEYQIQTGNMVGPTAQGVDALVEEDPGARWVEEFNSTTGRLEGRVENSSFSDWMDSPRVITIALFDPSQIQQPGMQTIRFNNFAHFFIEEQQNPREPIVGRFLFYVEGSDPSPNAGSLVRVLQLVR